LAKVLSIFRWLDAPSGNGISLRSPRFTRRILAGTLMRTHDARRFKELSADLMDQLGNDPRLKWREKRTVHVISHRGSGWIAAP
jgi:hypothetical protein